MGLMTKYPNTERFDREHDEKFGPPLCDGSWLWWSDGSHREVRPDGRLIDSAKMDEMERLLFQLYYAQLALQRAQSDFEDLKNRLLTQAKLALETADANCPVPPPSTGDLAQLKKLRASIGGLTKRHNSLYTQVNKPRQLTLSAEERKKRSAQKEAAQAALAELRKTD